MKKLITLCLLLATTFATKAQEMNFDETVKYINEKIECCSAFKTHRFEAKKNGDVTVYSPDGAPYVNFNFFDAEKEPNEHPIRSSMDKFGLAMVVSTEGYNCIEFNVHKKFIACIDTKLTAERLFNALLHLRSLCTKVKDPFDK